jgi:hypothetical protein
VNRPGQRRSSPDCLMPNESAERIRNRPPAIRGRRGANDGRDRCRRPLACFEGFDFTATVSGRPASDLRGELFFAGRPCSASVRDGRSQRAERRSGIFTDGKSPCSFEGGQPYGAGSNRLVGHPRRSITAQPSCAAGNRPSARRGRRRAPRCQERSGTIKAARRSRMVFPASLTPTAAETGSPRPCAGASRARGRAGGMRTELLDDQPGGRSRRRRAASECLA